jgi:excisionase family DNA binding protein
MITDAISFELISVDPSMTSLGKEIILDRDNQKAFVRFLADLDMQRRLERQEQAEESRRSRMKRKPKEAKVHVGSGTLTLADVASRLQVDRSTVRRYVATGKLVGSRIGENGPYRFHEKDVQKLLVSQGTAEEKDEELHAFIAKTIMRKR